MLNKPYRAGDEPVSGSVYPDQLRREMLRYVPEHARNVLDVGCHTGAFGAALKARQNCSVWGVEPNKETAAVAAGRLDRVLNGLFESSAPAIPIGSFDVIVFNDVLEHFADPWAALKLARERLAPGGCVVASIPNLRFIDNLLHIVKDQDFCYQATGIRDRTHLRFFTRKSVERLFAEAGYRVEQLEGVNEMWWTPSLVRRMAFRLLPSRLEDTKYVQFAVVARPMSGSHG